jgi:hypothetical protein
MNGFTVSKRMLKRIERGDFPNYVKLGNGNVAQLLHFTGEYYWNDDDTIRQELSKGWYYRINGESKFVGPYETTLAAQIAVMQNAHKP